MRGWLALAAVIAGIDAAAVVSGHRTLSRSFHDGHATHPLLVAAGTAYLLAHLYGVLPAQLDPLSRLGGKQ